MIMKYLLNCKNYLINFMIEIDSKTNSIIKDLVRFRDHSKYRDDKSIFFVEGSRIVKDIPHNLIDKVFVSKSKFNLYKDFIKCFEDNNVYILNDVVFDKIKDTINSQGIVATVKYNLIRKLDNNIINNAKNILVLDNIKDPGNLGTIIRLAEASNISIVILANNCCNLYNTKVIRSCMSSIFRVNIYISNNIVKDLEFLKSQYFKIYSTSLINKSIKYNSVNYKNKNVVILGNEANGVNKELIDISDNTIFIPMCGKIESLNVSIAATAICYEMMRQNNFYET